LPRAAAPPALHSFPTRRSSDLARAGKHVFVEKPLGLDVREAERAVRECAEHRVTLAVGYNWRFQPALVEARRMLEDARLGKLLQDRKSTRLNSSHRTISYAVFC